MLEAIATIRSLLDKFPRFYRQHAKKMEKHAHETFKTQYWRRKPLELLLSSSILIATLYVLFPLWKRSSVSWMPQSSLFDVSAHDVKHMHVTRSYNLTIGVRWMNQGIERILMSHSACWQGLVTRWRTMETCISLQWNISMPDSSRRRRRQSQDPCHQRFRSAVIYSLVSSAALASYKNTPNQALGLAWVIKGTDCFVRF